MQVAVTGDEVVVLDAGNSRFQVFDLQGRFRRETPAVDSVELAFAVELMHNMSLVVDDILDGSAERRGIATLQEKFNSTSAVNIDAEMSNLIQVQNTYAANAHLMSVVQSMMQTLLQAQT